ncbi:MAG TPA: HAMP domain-containing sensor histidine kinase [Pseudonocardia sp.]|nr:HAMP domain-containing sensor histidine kinase [Pseudonocardia sp.]
MTGGRRARTVADRGPRSLHARLVASVLLLLAAVCAVVGIATAVALRHFLLDQLDDDLASARGRFVGMQQDHGSAPPLGLAHGEQPDGGTDFLGPAQAPRTVGAVVVAGSVTDAVVSDRGGATSTVPGDLHATLAAVLPGAHPVSADLGDLGAYRLVATLDRDGSVLVIGLPQAGVDHLLGLLVLAEGVVIGVALLVAGVAGAVAVRRELRPLERVAATAARVSDLRLDSGDVELVERVPALDTDPRTEVGQVGVALNRMLDNVAAALEARHASETQLRQFVADASHELRTPLAAIRGYAELSGRDPALPPGAAYSLQRISSQSLRMSALVEDLLLLARLDAGRPLERLPVDLTRIVVDAVSDASAAGPRHRWRLTVPDEPVMVVGDGARLTQVLTNLLANARTHTPEGTEVTAGLAFRGSEVRLTVADTGPGIPADLLPHVFERFARGEASRARAANETASSGLGLAIVEAVTAAHGGSITVRSAPGRTLFTVRLPTGAAPQEPVILPGDEAVVRV